ncbi:hypothetical protein BFP97_05000 [Roseivirga sp. 4D4]|uniref:glycosyltransferase n=1 Tax=Roseivirga sp. 4D4 TaxID=1889784 RepID=UPI000853A532|nr:glycosyltransferase [Roseivirga sp. 4D4]OEK00907.1 hypothetical protein BFP97_05000 [Roseivirga sp. 4D4]
MNMRHNNREKEVIVCHSFPAWDTPYIKSTLELMTRLSATHRAIFIDYHYTWKDLFKHPNAPKKRLMGIKNRIRKEKTPYGTIEVVSLPPILPVNWINNRSIFKVFAKLNAWWLGHFIRRIKRQLGINNFTLFNALNPIYGLNTRKAWKAKKTIYYCYDEISGTQWAGKHGPDFEEAFAKQVDMIITTSRQLQKEKSKYNVNCHLVPNGVNLDIFQNPKISTEKTKTLGYIGAVDDRIDFDLLHHISQAMPDYQIDIYGPMKVVLPKLLVDRVKFHGAIPQEALPTKISQMDACLIPFVKNDLTAAIYPLKVNEYLAMGKPVISTDFADLSDFGQKISVSKNNDDFVSLVKREIRYNNRLKAQSRIDFAKGNSWDERAQTIRSLLSN